MQRPITRGASAGAGLIFHIFAQDSASTTGAGKASIAFSSWACRYIRTGEAISGAITPEDITTIGTYAAPTANTNIRIKAVDNTNMIGVYEVHAHADWVNATNLCQALTIYLTATGVAVLPFQIPLIGTNVQDAVRGGMTALPAANADAAGGLPISDAGGLDLDAKLANTNEVTAARMGALTDWINGGRLDLLLDAILEDTGTTLDGRIPAALVGGRMDANMGAISSDATAADNAEAFFDGTGYAGTNNVIPTVTTLTGHTAQTGDTYALANGANGFVALKAQTAAIEVDTTEIGVAGAGLTAINLPNQTMDIVGNITGSLSGSVGSVTGAVGSVTGAVGSVVAEVTPTTASKTGYRLSATGVGDVLTTALTEAYAADGAAPTLTQAVFGILQFLTERAIVTTTLTVNKLDGTTAAMTFTLNDATNPTAITRAT